MSIYNGGSNPGGALFFVDGDFSQCDPCGLPEFSYPMVGDSVLSVRDTVIYNAYGDFKYSTVPLGTYPNIQPWSANQVAAILEQEFMVAQSSYVPMNLNTPYHPTWAIGWEGFTQPVYLNMPPLNAFYLVKEGDLCDMGGGICKIRRTWSTIPAARNELEQFVYNFIGYADEQSGASRQSVPLNVLSRVQYDYFIFDDLDILSYISLFPNGPRLDSSTGLSPKGFILPAQYYFSGETNAYAQNLYTNAIDDGDGTDPTTATLPNFTDYTNFVSGGYSSNGLPAEIIAEASTITRWRGNIFERRTRFVIAQ